MQENADRHQEGPSVGKGQHPEATQLPDSTGASGTQLSDDAIEAMKRQRFHQRVQRVLAVMQQERIDWRGVPFITPDGRIGVRLAPVEMDRP